MYINPAYLPQVSNREDFVHESKLYDDVTGEPINLHNFATATTQEFTGTDWDVQIGDINTASATSITIPQLPSQGELMALALTIGTGLEVEEGDPIRIEDNANAGNYMEGYVVSYASATGALVCQIGWNFQCEIRALPPNWQPGVGYATWYDVGVAPQQPILKASYENGELFVVDLGVILINIPEATFKTLRSGTYGIYLTMTDSVNTRQIFIGRLPVLWGGVTN